MSIKDVIPIRLQTASALASGATNSRELPELASFQDAILYVTISAVSGTNPTLDVIVADRAPSATFGSGFVTIAAMQQMSTTGSYRLAIHGPFGTNTRVTFTVGGTATPTVTCSAEFVVTTEEAVPITASSTPYYDPQTGSTVLLIENFIAPTGLWNDGTTVTNNGMAGSVSRTWEQPLGGLPSMFVDCQGNTTSDSDPGRTANTAGVVFKRRLSQIVRGVSSVECYFKYTSTNATGANAFFSMSHYNRDGTNAHHGRLWLDTTTAGAYVLKYLASGGTWTACPTTNGVSSTINLALATHLYDLTSGRIDRAGGWLWWRLRLDFNANQYVDAMFNDQYYDLRGLSMDDTASVGAQMLHFSIEFAQKTSTRRYMNVAQVVCRRWG